MFLLFTATSFKVPAQEIRRHDTTQWDSPKYPPFSTRASRMSSFATWPANAKQKAENLSNAGFFYVGKPTL